MKTKEIMNKVVATVIAKMEKGIIPWEKPWTGANIAYSRSTGKPYSFLNQLGMEAGEYATFNQIKKEGGKVNKGAKGSIICYWDFIEKVTGLDDDGKEITKKIPFLKYYTVFNIATQTDLEVKNPLPEVATKISDMEAVKMGYINRESLDYKEVLSDSAYYSPSKDCVRVPKMEQFRNSVEYYSTVFHELAHSTGHASRLARGLENNAAFGSEDYSREELVAEMTAAGILAKAGHESDESITNTAAYLQSWMKALKDDPAMLFWAASRAEKALDYIVGPNTDTPEKGEKKSTKKATKKSTKKSTAKTEKVTTSGDTPEVEPGKVKKATFYINKKAGCELVKGYITSVVLPSGELATIGFHKVELNKYHDWHIDDIKSGLLVKAGFNTRKEAMEAIKDSELLAQIEECYGSDKFKEFVKQFAEKVKAAA